MPSITTRSGFGGRPAKLSLFRFRFGIHFSTRSHNSSGILAKLLCIPSTDHFRSTSATFHSQILSARSKLAKSLDQTGWTIGILNYSVDTAKVIKTVTVTCPGCNVDSVLTALTKALDPIVKDDPPESLCNLKVTSAPSGGTVSIDGTELGRAPFEHTVLAGMHTIAVQREGFAKGENSVACRAESGLTLDFTLSREQPTMAVVTEQGAASPQANPQPPSRSPEHGGAESTTSPHRNLFLALAGVSGALFVATTVWLIVEAVPHESGCVGGRCLFKYDNNNAIGLAAGGMALSLVAGSVFTYLAVHKSHRPHALTVLPAASPSGTTIQLLGRF